MIPAYLVVLAFGALLLFFSDQPKHPQPPKKLLTLNCQGFIFGEYHRCYRKTQYFYKSENLDGHILIVGGAGSGKSTSLAIPSLLEPAEKVRTKGRKRIKNMI
jgi:hypothetical protein